MRLSQAFAMTLSVVWVIQSHDLLATPFPNSGSLYRDVRDDSLRRAPRPDAEQPQVEVQQAPEQATGEADLQVSHFVVFGNVELSQQELSELLSPYSHQTLSPARLHEAIETLRRAYRERGLFATQVYLPPQAVEDGLVTLHVFEGVLEEGGVLLSDEGNHVRGSVVESILQENLATGEVMRVDEFERAILLADDLPGITTHSVIYPGASPGEARFLLRTEDTPRVTGNFDIDNFGNYYTGEERLGATVYFNSPTGGGDQLTFRAVTSGSDSTYVYSEYSLPVSGHGLRLGVSGDYLTYDLGEELGDLGADGEAYSGSVFAAYPFVRSRHANLNTRVEYIHLSLDDDDDSGVLEAERTLDMVTVSLYGDHDDDFWANGVTYFDASVTGGNVDIEGGDEFQDFDDRNMGIDGGFFKLNFDVSRLQHLGGNWSASGRFAGQAATTNLDSSQKFFIGGPFSVPGYPVAEMSGDFGVNLQADLRYDIRAIPWGGDLQVSSFASAGWVRLYEDTWEGWQGENPIISNNLELYSWGLAATQTWPCGVVFRSSIGRQIGNNDARNPLTGKDTDQSDDDYRAWFQIIYYFGVL